MSADLALLREPRASRRAEKRVRAAVARRAPTAHPAARQPAPRPPHSPAQPPPRPLRGHRPRASLAGASLRLLIWLWALARYVFGALGDALVGRASLERRAVHLRRIFEGLGPTFVKLGQQLSLRSDLIPHEICRELALMQDRAPPIAVARARSLIERSTGAAIAINFRELEAEPIGSASLSCVYRASLHSGERVAVKVRRPGVVEVLAADARALGWILQLAEWLSLFKPGFTKNLREELTSMLFEELDFTREARNTEIFRAEAEQQGQPITAPRVYFELCSEELLVTEYVRGVFLNRILRALDEGDGAVLAELAAERIELATVARNLMRVAHWQSLEALLFHADPHPANICVLPGGSLVFIDFGACGRLTGRHRRLWQRFYEALSRRDVQDMVACAVAVLEPLPRLDVDAFSREIELMYWDWIYALRSEHADWWEKASGLLWMRFAGIARRHQAHVNAEVIRIFRASFLYDTVVFRLARELDMRREFLSARRSAGKRARRRVLRQVRRRLISGLREEDYLAIEQLWGAGRQLLARLQGYLDMPAPTFAPDLGKLAYAAVLLLRAGGGALGLLLAAALGARLYQLVLGPIHTSGLLAAAAGASALEVAAAAALWLAVRKLVVKLRERDLGGPSR